jgi:hypothetical protein
MRTAPTAGTSLSLGNGDTTRVVSMASAGQSSGPITGVALTASDDLDLGTNNTTGAALTPSSLGMLFKI